VNVHNRKLIARADDLAVEMLSSVESSVSSPDGASMDEMGAANLSGDNDSGVTAAFTFTLPPSSYATVCLQEIMQSRG
jgi:tRNA(Glu) U13 pseudouridine synthase TruD